jgi:hypothetical protein
LTGKTITLSYYNGTWTTIGTTTTTTNGVYQYNWNIPPTITKGQYALQAQFAGDSYYDESSATTGGAGNGGNLFVLPEYLLGGLAALGACFAALVLFKERHRFSHNKSPFV